MPTQIETYQSSHNSNSSVNASHKNASLESTQQRTVLGSIDINASEATQHDAQKNSTKTTSGANLTLPSKKQSAAVDTDDTSSAASVLSPKQEPLISVHASVEKDFQQHPEHTSQEHQSNTTAAPRSADSTATNSEESQQGSSPSPQTGNSSQSQSQPQLAPYDQADLDDPQKCALYMGEITEHFISLEQRYPPCGNFLKNQVEITATMRAILVDWLLDVHYKFHFHQETLYLTVNLIDRFLAQTRCSRGHFQLLGIAALMVASKYEEIYHPKTKKLLEICAGVYTKDQFLKMEVKLLKTLNYRITVVTPYFFLKRFLHICGANKKTKLTAFYMSELALVNYDMSSYKSSHLAAACVWLSLRLNSPNIVWNDSWAEDIGYTTEQLGQCVRDLAPLVAQERNYLTLKRNSCSKKYSRERRMSISQVVPTAVSMLNL